MKVHEAQRGDWLLVPGGAVAHRVLDPAVYHDNPTTVHTRPYRVNGDNTLGDMGGDARWTATGSGWDTEFTPIHVVDLRIVSAQTTAYPELWFNVFTVDSVGHHTRRSADAYAKGYAVKRLGVIHLQPDGTLTMEDP